MIPDDFGGYCMCAATAIAPGDELFRIHDELTINSYTDSQPHLHLFMAAGWYVNVEFSSAIWSAIITTMRLLLSSSWGAFGAQVLVERILVDCGQPSRLKEWMAFWPKSIIGFLGYNQTDIACMGDPAVTALWIKVCK